MGLKLIRNVVDKSADFSRQAKVYRDAEWQEFRVKFYRKGVYQKNADYHTTDRQDAIDTATSYAEGKLTEAARVMKKQRAGNPEKGPAGSEIATQSEMGAFIDEMDRITLYATPLGKTRGVKSWEKGEVFQAVNPPHWSGSPFFRSSDAERIYAMGYRKIVVIGSGGDGFDVDLVMQ